MGMCSRALCSAMQVQACENYFLIYRKLEVNMPKFSMEESYALHQILPDLGVSSIFSESSNLTGLSKDKGLKVSEVRWSVYCSPIEHFIQTV